jgi:hypothetical protein
MKIWIIINKFGRSKNCFLDSISALKKLKTCIILTIG